MLIKQTHAGCKKSPLCWCGREILQLCGWQTVKTFKAQRLIDILHYLEMAESAESALGSWEKAATAQNSPAILLFHDSRSDELLPKFL